MAKNFSTEETEAMRIGTTWHKHFEERIGFGRPLPAHMADHEPLMQEIEAGADVVHAERKVGLNKKLEPCGFFDPDVWWRGVIDVDKRVGDRAIIVDYKTGKVHNKMRQLWLFALYGFKTGAKVVETYYYWTQFKTRTRIILPAAQEKPILRSLVPDLTAYKEAYNTDTWPENPSGLCKRHCPVTTCEFHGKGPTRHR